MSNFRPIDHETGFLMPPSVDDWLSQRHLARFMVEVIGPRVRNAISFMEGGSAGGRC
jgi:hypothetical protein